LAKHKKVSKQLTEYVIVHARHPDGKLLLVLKDRPAWQKGRLNLVGGKVEPGETCLHAAMREFHEETGMMGNPLIPNLCGAIKGVDCVVYCFSINVYEKTINPRKGETEKVDWYSLDVFNDPRLMPNLRLVIPLLQMGVTNWIITDDKPSIAVSDHEVMVSLGIDEPFMNG